MKIYSKEPFRILFACIALGVIARIIPHIPNVSPLTPLALFIGTRYSIRTGVFAMFAIVGLSNLILNAVHQYPVFDYSFIIIMMAYLAVLYIGQQVIDVRKNSSILSITCLASLIFWGWTNFGVWLISGMYPASIEGFTACYWLALPFLRNAILGNMMWALVIFKVTKVFEGQKEKTIVN